MGRMEGLLTSKKEPAIHRHQQAKDDDVMKLAKKFQQGNVARLHGASI